MAFKKTLAQRLLSITKISTQSLSTTRIPSSSLQSRIPPSAAAANRDIAPDPGDGNVFRRFLHERATAFPPSDPRSPPSAAGDIIRRLREMDIARNRIRLDGLAPPEMTSLEEEKVAVDGARKMLMAAQVETVKSKLRKVPQSCISYSEFVRICAESFSDREQAVRVAKILDDSASVIVVGDVVYLRPEQVVKTIQVLLPIPEAKASGSVTKELEEMEKVKRAIDNKANTLVRRELWGGLGFLLVQTAAFMRLTFWELTWDVMEPICFYVGSTYFMACYAFFLTTSKEPSFEALFQSRFSTKQKRLMKLHNFDMARYNELRAASKVAPSSELDSSIPHPFGKFQKKVDL